METQLVLCFLLFVTVTVNVFFFGCDTTQRLNSDGYIKVIAHGSPTKSCHVPLHFLSTLQRFRHLSLQVWLFLSQCQQSASLISISSQQAAFFEFRCSNSLRFVWVFFFLSVFLSAWLKAWNSYFFFVYVQQTDLQSRAPQTTTFFVFTACLFSMAACNISPQVNQSIVFCLYSSFQNKSMPCKVLFILIDKYR